MLFLTLFFPVFFRVVFITKCFVFAICLASLCFLKQNIAKICPFYLKTKERIAYARRKD